MESLGEAWIDAIPDPQVLLEATRTPEGRVTDFVCRGANPVACRQIGRTQAELLGRTLSTTLPVDVPPELLARSTHCLDTAEPLAIDDVPFGRPDRLRYFDVRASRAGPDLLAVSWRDVTDRFELTRDLAESEQHFRLLADNASDVVVRFIDDRITWVSPSVRAAMGAPPEYWIGRSVVDLIAVDDAPLLQQILDETAAGATSVHRLRGYGADGDLHWVEIHVKMFYGSDGAPDGWTASVRVVDDEVAAEQQNETARLQQAEADARYRRLIESSVVATNLVAPQGHFILVNQAMCDFVGYDADTLLKMNWSDVTALDDLEEAMQAAREVLAGERVSYQTNAQYIHADGRRLWGALTVSCIRSPDGGAESLISQIVDITAEVETRRQLDEARRRQAASAELYRNTMECAAVGMCLVGPEGTFIEVNDALCEFFGYDAESLLRMTWQEITAPAHLEADIGNIDDLLTGRRDSYRFTKQYIHADGSLIWGDLSVGCLRGADGQVEVLIAQVVDITADVRAREQLAAQQARNQLLAQQLTSEIRSAADYVVSTLPADSAGPVALSSRYLPSLELGGDCFNYAWLDDDHLMIYLIDIAGHGIKPALLSMSVHNLLRSGSLPTGVQLKPERVLAKLNTVFQMEQQDNTYFTIWYGVFEASSRTLLYASAGHPPALAFAKTADGEWQCTPLRTASLPVGMFEDTRFESGTYAVPVGGRILLFSDGAFDFPLSDGQSSTLGEFTLLVKQLMEAGQFCIDTLVEKLRSRSADGHFTDDCSLISAEFP